MLSKKDLLILTQLRKDARNSLALIARSTGIPVSTVFERTKALEKSVITKNTTLLNFSLLGHSLRVNFVLRAADQEKLVAYLEHPSVNTVYRLMGDCFFVEAAFRDMMGKERFMEGLKDFAEVEDSHYVIEDVKREAFLTRPSHIKAVR